MDWLWNSLPSGLTGGAESSSSRVDAKRQKWLDMQGPPRSGNETPDDTGTGGLEVGVGREGERQRLLVSPGRPAGRPGARGQQASREDSRMIQGGASTDLVVASSAPGREARRRHALHSWEIESDDSAEVASEGERAATRWSPFMNREETEQADYAENRMREQSEPEGPDELGRLEAYEEHALGLRPMAKKAVTKASGSLSPDEVAAIVDAGDEESAEEEEDQEQEHAFVKNKDRAKREGLAAVEVPGDGGWSHHGGKWIGSGLGGGLAIDHGSRVSYAYYEEMTFKDFDVEAEFFVTDGDHVGLLFNFVPGNAQHSHHTYYALCINLMRQQAELRSTSDAVALAPVHIQKCTWFQLRVRAAGSTLMFFVDYRQVGQRVCYHEKDRVLLRDTGEEAMIKKNYGDGNYEIEHQGGVQDVAGRQLFSLLGHVGIWCQRTVASMKNMVVLNLEDMVHDMCLHDQQMITEGQVMKEKAKATRATMLRKTKAARLIQEISKLNLSLMHQRMLMYDQAVRQGRDDQMRHRKLLVWFSLFSVFQKFNEVMATPEKKERRQVLYLELLDAKDPPPPAPPLKEPPRASDEELHYRYEERRNKYAHRWEKAGKMVVGQERFEEIVNMESGPAEREKRLIAQACFQKATQVMSEQEHQEFLGKAWRLENDWTSTDDAAAVTEEIERWRDEKMRVTAPKEKSKSRSRLNLNSG